MSFQPRTRLQKILMGIAATPRTALEHAVKYAVDHAGGGGGGSSDIVRVPFTLTVTGGETSGTTDANLADTLAARSNGKVIVAVATIDLGGGIVQYIDGIMVGGTAGDNSELKSTAIALSGDGTKFEAYCIKWSSAGVEVSKKDITVS